MFLYYIIITIILCILIVHGYNKVRHKFWMTQPIFYRYNMINWFKLNRFCSTERPSDTIYLNFINNIVTHITNTNIPIIIDNIHINETEKSINYYEDIVKLINKYPYFNKKINNGNKKSIAIDRKMTVSKLKNTLINHDYNAIVTMNKKLIYKTDVSTSDILSVDTVMGVVISVPYYCRFESSRKGDIIPIYYSAIYYDSQNVQEKNVIEMIQTHNYKIYDDWDRALLRHVDYSYNALDIDNEDMPPIRDKSNNRIKKDVKRLTREIMINSTKIKNKNPYEENDVNISKTKEKIYASIYKYTGNSIPKVIVPFVVYHRFYIPISSQPSQKWNNIEYRFHPSIQLIKIGTQNITLLYEFLESCYEGLDKNNNPVIETSYKYKLPFRCCIIPSLRHIFHMINTNIYSVYVLLQKNNNIHMGGDTTNIIAMYLFCNSEDTVSNDIKIDKKYTIYLTTSVIYGSIQNSVASSFIYGFINALKLETKKKDIGCIAIDTLSHNKPLIDFLVSTTKPLMVEKNNLVFYNYICNTLSPEQVMIMNS